MMEEEKPNRQGDEQPKPVIIALGGTPFLHKFEASGNAGIEDIIRFFGIEHPRLRIVYSPPFPVMEAFETYWLIDGYVEKAVQQIETIASTRTPESQARVLIKEYEQFRENERQRITDPDVRVNMETVVGSWIKEAAGIADSETAKEYDSKQRRVDITVGSVFDLLTVVELQRIGQLITGQQAQKLSAQLKDAAALEDLTIVPLLSANTIHRISPTVKYFNPNSPSASRRRAFLRVFNETAVGIAELAGSLLPRLEVIDLREQSESFQNEGDLLDCYIFHTATRTLAFLPELRQHVGKIVKIGGRF